MNISRAREIFLRGLRLEGLSQNTLDSYGNDLNQFERILGDVPVEKITPDDLKSYIQELLDVGVGKSSINRKLSALKKFFGWLVDEDLISTNPTLKVKKLKTVRPKPKALVKEEVVRIFKKIKNKRDLALFTLIFHSGLRIGEALSLNVRDIDPNKDSFLVRGKGSKVRTCFLSREARRTLRNYLKVRPKVDTPALFVSRESHRLSYRSAIETFQKYAKAAGVEATIHSLRHTFATLSLEAGTDIRYLQEMLGHASITSTQIYTKVNSTKLHQEFDKAQKNLSLS